MVNLVNHRCASKSLCEHGHIGVVARIETLDKYMAENTCSASVL